MQIAECFISLDINLVTSRDIKADTMYVSFKKKKKPDRPVWTHG